MVTTSNLQYRYRKGGADWVLAGINIELASDEYVLICGPSGSGKSTLCRTFNGLIPHFYGGVLAGEVRVAGVTTAAQSVTDLFAQVGMVFQNPETQLFNQTVAQEIAFGLESLGLPRPEIERRVTESATLLEIEDLLPRNPRDLSGGEQQLVLIGAILALRPQLLVLDEPYANLDPINVRRVRATLRAIHQQGVGLVLSEHRLHYAVADVERMVVLHQGQVVFDGPPDEVLRQDLEPFGLEVPLVAQVGRQLAWPVLPMGVEAVKRAIPDPLSLPNQQFRPPAPVPQAEPVLTFEEVSFVRDGQTILDKVNLTLYPGECLAVVGANGAGKTTLLKHLNGLYRPTQGRVLVREQDTRRAKVSQLARHVGLAFQNPNNQFFKLTVWDEITVGARALNRYDEGWLEELVELFRLGPLLDRSPYKLSEGEKKRVAFAAALAARPAILALDEPTAGQDWYFRRALGELFAALRARGQAIMFVTHDLVFAEQQAHRWLLLSKGQVVAEGRPDQVMSDEAAMRRANLEPTERFQLFGERVAV